MRGLLPCPKDKGSGRTDLKLYCLEGVEKYKYCLLPLLLSSLPSSPQTWLRAGAAPVWTLFSITHAGPKHRICWACGKCSSGCVTASVGFGSQGREYFALFLVQSQRAWDSLCWGYPSWKLAHTGCMWCRCSSCGTFSEVWCVWLSVHAYHLTITRTGRKVWLFFCCCCCFSFSS